jgi:hypothetical protein
MVAQERLLLKEKTMSKDHFNAQINAVSDALENTKAAPVDRRRMLAVLGLAATTAYVAPTLLSVSQARASEGSGGSGGGSGGGGSGGRGSRGSRGSGGGFGGRGGSRGSGGRGRSGNNPFPSIVRGLFK